MSSFKARHAGTWKDGVPYARHAGTWKPWLELWQKASGVWQKVWVALSVTVYGGFNADHLGGGSYRDRAVLSLDIQPASTPSAYAWEFSDSGGWLTSGSLTGPTLTLTSESVYNPINFNTSANVAVWCTVTINGSPIRTANIIRTYTVDGFS